MIDAVRQHILENAEKKEVLANEHWKFLAQIVKQLLEDEEFAKKTLPIIKQRYIKPRLFEHLIGIIKDYFQLTGVVPTQECVKSLIEDKYGDVECAQLLELLDYCCKIQVSDRRKEEIKLHWNLVFVEFQYIVLLNRLYDLAINSQSDFLSQYALMKNMTKDLEYWRTDFYNDEGVMDFLGDDIPTGKDDDWDAIVKNETGQIYPLNGSNLPEETGQIYPIY